MTKQICRRNKYGYCKYNDKCRFRHINEKCVAKECNIFDCEKRHPKICNYIREFGRCKFTTFCRYDHEKPDSILENSEKIEKLEKKIDQMQNNEMCPKVWEMKFTKKFNYLKINCIFL